MAKIEIEYTPISEKCPTWEEFSKTNCATAETLYCDAEIYEDVATLGFSFCANGSPRNTLYSNKSLTKRGYTAALKWLDEQQERFLKECGK